jgi:hypothetical protein
MSIAEQGMSNVEGQKAGVFPSTFDIPCSAIDIAFGI